MEKMFQNIPFKLLVRVKFYFGQSLQEFIIVLPILIFIVVAGTNFALGVHKAHMLSDASHWIASQKFRLADNDNSVGQVELRSLINSSSGVSDTLTRRDFIDQIRFNSIDRYFTIIEASTEQNALSNFVNGFEFKTSQVINRPLLLATSAGGPSRRLNIPWVPGGQLRRPPWNVNAISVVNSLNNDIRRDDLRVSITLDVNK